MPIKSMHEHPHTYICVCTYVHVYVHQHVQGNSIETDNRFYLVRVVHTYYIFVCVCKKKSQIFYAYTYFDK